METNELTRIFPPIPKLVEDNAELTPFADLIVHQLEYYRKRLAWIESCVGSLEEMANGHRYFGFNRGEHDGESGWFYREWAPAAKALYLIGDFNDWDCTTHPMECDQFGVWSIFLPDREYADRLKHGCRVKVHVVSERGAMDRIPAYIRKTEKDPVFQSVNGVLWDPKPYPWQNPQCPPKGALRIYEAHVGMASEEEKICTFEEFRKEVLPRIVKQGYNALQLMAIMQHPYYASFGYQVSNFFAVSDFFGTPEDLKRLIDDAHGAGISVFLDLIHSHAIKNIHEGINEFDGTSYQYFHAGGRGEHLVWDSKLFDYSKFEVLRFLLSNLRYWLEEFRFDGFRFDGITSMIYLHHGIGVNFDEIQSYFQECELDRDAICYLQLANTLVHRLRPEAVTIAEDVSGYPGLARPVDEGGLGFDYRLAMGEPELWVNLVEHVRDEHWHMENIFRELTNRRENERYVAYVESHDQAMVGEKTLAFRLMGPAMYSDMAKHIENPIIERGVRLHNLIRLITFFCGGDGWLNFMGNEFGHPDWIDFPRAGNNLSFFYARRQWSLADNSDLRYAVMNRFDRLMNQFDARYHILSAKPVKLQKVHEDHKLLVIQRGHFIGIFNFHPTSHYQDYRIG
ncbi:MAG: 1,4-alpha-glucan-branching enzyme, partial [Lentisphaerae bacterium]